MFIYSGKHCHCKQTFTVCIVHSEDALGSTSGQTVMKSMSSEKEHADFYNCFITAEYDKSPQYSHVGKTELGKEVVQLSPPRSPVLSMYMNKKHEQEIR